MSNHASIPADVRQRAIQDADRWLWYDSHWAELGMIQPNELLTPSMQDYESMQRAWRMAWQHSVDVQMHDRFFVTNPPIPPRKPDELSPPTPPPAPILTPELSSSPTNTASPTATHTPSVVSPIPVPTTQSAADAAGLDHKENDATEPCPNGNTCQNLCLGINEVYRAAIVATSERTGIAPQALSALIGAEAATYTLAHQIQESLATLGYYEGRIDGDIGPASRRAIRQLQKRAGLPETGRVDDATKQALANAMSARSNGSNLPSVPVGAWNPLSRAPKSSAAGLTQFISGTWQDMAGIKESYLNNEMIRRGYANSEGVIRRELLTSRQPIQFVESLTTEILDLRYDPMYSIQTAADYARHNMNSLARNGYDLSILNSSEQAKVMYLTHHLGIGDALTFIGEGRLSEKRASIILPQQVDKEAAQELFIQHGSWSEAHRQWLSSYIDRKIQPSRYACIPENIPQARSTTELSQRLRESRVQSQTNTRR